jgi:tRNA-Thr(GGU) m(6)t(6)A37 methyltransferase TsaA
MKSTTADGEKSFRMGPVGYVRKTTSGVHLEMLEAFRPALKQLGHFSHVIVLWWADKRDSDKYRRRLQTRPPYAHQKVTGVFACRAEYRPNPVAITTCRIRKVDEEKGRIEIADIDASDGTPIVDLKAYFPVLDRVKDPRTPEWLPEWPEWVPC